MVAQPIEDLTTHEISDSADPAHRKISSSLLITMPIGKIQDSGERLVQEFEVVAWRPGVQEIVF
jgi:hypothetical protein